MHIAILERYIFMYVYSSNRDMHYIQAPGSHLENYFSLLQ